jgi:hypothetical protein
MDHRIITRSGNALTAEMLTERFAQMLTAANIKASMKKFQNVDEPIFCATEKKALMFFRVIPYFIAF